MDDSLLSFELVPLRSRRDGWTPERQRAFIALIAKGLKPGRAAERVGMRRQGAYELRERAGAAGFAAAWDAAAAIARRRRAAARLEGTLYARAIDGMPVPIRHRGRVVAIDRRVDNAALIRLLGMADRSLKSDDGSGGLF